MGFGISSQSAVGTHRPQFLQRGFKPRPCPDFWLDRSFILGIGFYSIPKLRRTQRFSLWIVWTSWALWTCGVALRWLIDIYEWHWRILLPISAILELCAFLLFFRTVAGHRSESGKAAFEYWVIVVIAGSLGLLVTLILNLGVTLQLALRGTSPAVPSAFDQEFLVLQTWGVLVIFVWGFSAKWLPTFLGLKPTHSRLLLLALALNCAGVAVAFTSHMLAAAVLLLIGAATAIYSLRLLERSVRPAKVKGVHPSFPAFVRIAYSWTLVAAGLGVWAASAANSQGIWGASRHALTVGFLAMMVFAIGQRILPAFSGMRLLFSTNLMFVALILLALGCLLRVGSEVLAYQNLTPSAWRLLPVSAVTEMTAVTVFAVNLLATFASRPPSTTVAM